MTIATLQANAEKALKQAVNRLIRESRKTGEPLIVWRHGKLHKLYPNRIVKKSSRVR